MDSGIRSNNQCELYLLKGRQHVWNQVVIMKQHVSSQALKQITDWEFIGLIHHCETAYSLRHVSYVNQMTQSYWNHLQWLNHNMHIKQSFAWNSKRCKTVRLHWNLLQLKNTDAALSVNTRDLGEFLISNVIKDKIINEINIYVVTELPDYMLYLLSRGSSSQRKRKVVTSCV